jgi:hypothetical protein
MQEGGKETGGGFAINCYDWYVEEEKEAACVGCVVCPV